jgi:hypothetical protein
MEEEKTFFKSVRFCKGTVSSKSWFLKMFKEGILKVGDFLELKVKNDVISRGEITKRALIKTQEKKYKNPSNWLSYVCADNLSRKSGWDYVFVVRLGKSLSQIKNEHSEISSTIPPIYDKHFFIVLLSSGYIKNGEEIEVKFSKNHKRYKTKTKFRIYIFLIKQGKNTMDLFKKMGESLIVEQVKLSTLQYCG